MSKQFAEFAVALQERRRTEAIQNALGEAAQVPLEGLQLSVEALELLKKMAPDISPFLSSDVGTAAALLEAGMKGCELNVLINAQSIKDRKKSNSLKKDTAELVKKGKNSAAALQRQVRKEYEKK